MFAVIEAFIANKIFVVNKISSIKDDNKLIEKFIKPKIRKLFNQFT